MKRRQPRSAQRAEGERSPSRSAARPREDQTGTDRGLPATLRAVVRWFWIFLGGGLGSVGRVAVSQLILSRMGAALPWGTFAVNVVGCFVIGATAAWFESRGQQLAHPFFVVGLLGGFTTFSTFSIETLLLVEAARPAAAALNAAGSLAACLLAVAGGFSLVRSVTY